MKLYAFDEIDEQLELVPLSARRAFDAAGLKPSRAAWLSLPLETRRRIAELGSGPTIDAAEVRELGRGARPAPDEIAPPPDPDASGPPPHVTSAFGAERPISGAVWSALSPLDRYALAKVADKPRRDRLEGAYREIVGQSALSTHLAPQGGVRMVSVSSKAPSLRRAVAESSVTMAEPAFARLKSATAAKGDVLGTARLAGIMAAKRTPELVPLCHHVALDHVAVELELDEARTAVRISASAESFGRTGVEMEAMVAASVAALTVYDMLKGYDRSMEIGPTRLTLKSGGRTGEFRR